MGRETASPWLALAVLLVVVCYSRCQDEDWSIGCYRERITAPCFNFTAPGDYKVVSNLTADGCVPACSAMSNTSKYAGITLGGVCLCSQDVPNCSQKVNDTLCSYPSNDAYYFRVYPVAELPHLLVPSSAVMVFQPFQVNISSADPNCTYTMDFGDGIKKTVANGSASTHHYYTSAGEYTVELSSNVKCLPQKVKAVVRSVFGGFGGVNLTCPDVIETTDKDSCELTIEQGAGLDITDVNTNSLLGNISDTVVETIGSYINDANYIAMMANGTFVFPFVSALSDGIITAVSLNVFLTGELKVQVLSPSCSVGQMPCMGGCVSNDSCPGPKINLLSSESCCTRETLLSTNSSNSTDYTVRSEFDVNLTAGTNLFRLSNDSNPVRMTRGDIIALQLSSSATIELASHNSSYVLYYCNQKFQRGETISVSNAQHLQRRHYSVRVHMISPLVLEIPIEPKVPHVNFTYNVSSAPAMKSDVVSAVVKVQERVSGLQIFEPLVGKYYATEKDVSFVFNVSNGTNVTYTFSPGDGSEIIKLNQSRTTQYVYKRKGNYTFNVTASNSLNSVSKNQTAFIVLDIKNLKFIKDPKNNPGEVGKPYNFSFSLEVGDRPVFQVVYGNNMTYFSSCDTVANQTITVNITYEAVGRYNITVVALSLLSTSLTINSTVDIQIPIENLSVFLLLKESPTTSKTYFIGQAFTIHANVSVGSPVNYNFTVLENANEKHKNAADNTNKAEFEFSSSGARTIRVTAWNALSKITRNLTVNITNECESEIKILDAKSKDECLKITRGSDVRVSTDEVYGNTDCKPSTCWSYNWTLFDDNATQVEKGYNRHSANFFISKRTLDPGLYRLALLALFALCNNSTRTNPRSEKETYVCITGATPVAIILGGSRRDVTKPPNGLITLDATTSYDPDKQNFNSSGLSFRWSCAGNCTNITLIGKKMSTLQVNTTLLNTEKSFEIIVVVTASFNRTGKTSQKITLVNEDVPTTEIVCRINCLPFVIPTDRLALAGQSQDPGEVNFTWTLTYSNRTEVRLNPNDTSTGFHHENLVLNANLLSRGTEYRVKLIAKHGTLQSTSVYQFKTAGQLRGGKCEISPTSGIALSTDFYVKCSNWKGGESPLTYDIRYQSRVEADSQVSSIKETVKHEWILWYHGEEQKIPANKLPAGLKNENYLIPITVEIRGKYGEYAMEKLTVKVKAEEINSTELDEGIEDLDKLDGKGDSAQKVAQLAMTIASVLNDNETKGSDTVDQKDYRLKLVQQLSKIEDGESLPLIQQTADAIKLATYESTQVTPKTQEIASSTLKRMGESLLRLASDPSSRAGQKIDEAARSMWSGLSKVLSASFLTGQDTSEQSAPKKVIPNLYGTLSKEGADLKQIGEQTQRVVNELEKSIEYISTAVARNKLIGEERTTVKTGIFNLALKKMSLREEHDGGKIIAHVDHGTTEAKISLPRLSFWNSTKQQNHTEIYTEFIAFNENPFTWDIKHSHYIQPGVVSFAFREDNGKEIKVKDLKEDIKITLPNRPTGIVYHTMNRSEENEKFLIFSFSLTEYHYDEMIMIDVKKTCDDQAKGANPTIYVKYGSKVSQTNFDFKHELRSNCSNCREQQVHIKNHGQNSTIFIDEEEKVRCGRGIISVGLLPCPVGTTPSCDMQQHNYTIFVQTVSCRYWNITEWMKDGCRVGVEARPDETSCLCNHLTTFSSYIVKPNPLNKFSSEAFEQGFVCFVAVIIIFILYFILLLWARRADRDDCTRVGVCALSDNKPQDRYRYEIAIWTGMRRNAGTASEISIILSGDKHDTQPRSLVNPSNKYFARGSLEKFLLTTSLDIGSLYCIRVWHDNSRGSWYLSRVMVTDLQKDERYYFICDRWLAVDEDDGTVERLLPMASDEELADFHHLFYSRTKRGLSDTHLWVSVLNRPPQSLFTRVQRLSCCLCIIMTTMLANAMFYETRSEPTADSTNFIGSYSFTWDEVFIGIVSSLIIVPVNMVILYIFRNVRPKSRKSRSHSKMHLASPDSGYHNIHHSQTSLENLTSSHDTPRDSIGVDLSDIYSRGTPDELKKKREVKLSRWAKFKKWILPSSLPHWFLYVGWLLLVLVTLGSATVVVLYGMQFGNGRSLQWLFSIIISICEDIFVLQPLKVLVFALGFALLVKKPDEGEFEMSEDDYEAEVEQHEVISGSENEIPQKQAAVSARLPVRPDEEQLAVMRKARLKERKMLFLVQEIIVHLIFSIVIGLVTYGHKDSRSVYLFRHMDELSAMTKEIHNFSMFWNWSEQVLIPKAFPDTIYNGRYVPRYGFFDDGYNNLISKARIRLLRVKNDSCNVADEFKDTIGFCLKDYSMFNQDEACYRPSWEKSKNAKKKTPWCFQSWRKLDGYPFWGIFNTYSGSGYINELTPGTNMAKIIKNLDSRKWLNEHARAAFLEMTTYNANINLFTSITLLFEFPEFGGVFYFRNIVPMRLKLYVGGFAFFIFACEMIFLVFIAGYTYIALKKLYRNKMAYFKNFWNAIDFAILITSYTAIGIHVYRMGLTTILMERVKDRKGEFVNFQFVTYWNEVFNCVVALAVALTTVKLTKLMRFNLRISLFGKTLENAKPALAMFSIQMGIVFFAYVMVGVLVFGYNVSQFKSIPSAMLALGRVILGKSQFRELFLSDAVIGPLFFFTYVMFVCWILFTMFVAILMDSYHEVQDKCYGMRNDYEIIDFFLARLRAWSGLGNRKKKVPVDKKWRAAALKVKAARAIGRQRSYKPSAENIAFEKTGDLMEKLEDGIKAIEKRVQHLSVHFQ